MQDIENMQDMDNMEHSEESKLAIAHSMFFMVQIVNDLQGKTEEDRKVSYELLAAYQSSIEELVMKDIKQNIGN